METSEFQPESVNSSFETQFSKKEKLETSVGLAEIVDIKPLDYSSEPPILLAVGWGETPITHQGTLRTIFNEKRRGIAIKYPRFIHGDRSDTSQPKVEIEKAQAILDVLNTKGIATADIIAHSEGAINAIIAATSAPEKFRNIVFIGPAGLIGKDKLPSLALRFAKMLFREGKRFLSEGNKRKTLLMAAWESLKYSFKNPTRALKEGSAIAASDIYESLANLQKQGINVSIIHSVDDSVFPMDKLLETAKEKGGLDVTGFYSVKGNHREISVNPRQYAALAVDALKGLQRKRLSIESHSSPN